MVFLNEPIFNEKTGWRHYAYAPIGYEARYDANILRGKTWSICAAITMDNLLPYTGIKQGYYSADNFYGWLQEHLLPALEVYSSSRPMVIIMDNVSIHIHLRVTQLIEAAGHIYISFCSINE